MWIGYKGRLELPRRESERSRRSPSPVSQCALDTSKAKLVSPATKLILDIIFVYDTTAHVYCLYA